MANRLKARNTRPANREASGRGLPMEKTPLPQFVIGRSLVSRRELRKPHEYAETNDMLGFLKEIEEDKSNAVLGRVALPQELFVRYVSNTQLNSMFELYLHDTKGARRREKRSLRAIGNMQQLFCEAQRKDGELSNIDLRSRTYAQSFVEGDDDLYLPVIDPGPFDKWGEIGVGCKKQPCLIDERTIGVALEVTDALSEDYHRVVSLLGCCGLDVSVLNDAEWEPSVPIFRTFGEIPRQSSVENVKIPPAPDFTAAQPVTIRSFQG